MRALHWAPIRPTDSIVELGCGAGRITAELLRRAPHGRVLAVDHSAEALDRLWARLAPQAGDRLSVLHADMDELEFRGPVDGVFSASALHFVADHERLFRTVRGALHPGGWFAVHCAGAGNLERVRTRAARLPLRDADGRSPLLGVNYPEPEATRRALAEAGFHSVHVESAPSPVPLGDAESYRSALERILGLPAVSGSATRRALARLQDLAAADDPPFTLEYVRLDFVARAS
jgi:trans-aconitate 2-methyltransferase